MTCTHVEDMQLVISSWLQVTVRLSCMAESGVHVTSLPGSFMYCLHFATAHVPILTN